jgi:type II secretory pathway component PulF
MKFEIFLKSLSDTLPKPLDWLLLGFFVIVAIGVVVFVYKPNKSLYERDAVRLLIAYLGIFIFALSIYLERLFR